MTLPALSSSSCSCTIDMAATASTSSSNATASASGTGSSTSDKYYGHKELAEFCDYVVTDLFCLASPLSETPPRSPGISKKNPPRLAEFIAYAIYRTRLAGPIIHQALFYLQRLKAKYPAARGTESSPHRLFLSALMLSAKMSMDDCYSNKSWVIVGGSLFSLKEVNQMERELFGFLDYDLACEHETLDGFVNDRTLDWESRKQATVEQAKFQLCYPRELLASRSRSQQQQQQHERRHTADHCISLQSVEPMATGSASSLEAGSVVSVPPTAEATRKRRVSDPVCASAQRHKRASDAAMALLRPNAKFSPRAFHNKARNHSCQSTPPSLSSSGSASLSSSEMSTPCSPLSMQQQTSPDMSEACDEYESVSACQKSSPLQPISTAAVSSAA